MSDINTTPVDAEVEALRERSAALIAEMATINQRIDQLSAKAKQETSAPAITDTWVEVKPGEDLGPPTDAGGGG